MSKNILWVGLLSRALCLFGLALNLRNDSKASVGICTFEDLRTTTGMSENFDIQLALRMLTKAYAKSDFEGMHITRKAAPHFKYTLAITPRTFVSSRSDMWNYMHAPGRNPADAVHCC